MVVVECLEREVAADMRIVLAKEEGCRNDASLWTRVLGYCKSPQNCPQWYCVAELAVQIFDNYCLLVIANIQQYFTFLGIR